jgi:hypothetical protein
VALAVAAATALEGGNHLLADGPGPLIKFDLGASVVLEGGSKALVIPILRHGLVLVVVGWRVKFSLPAYYSLSLPLYAMPLGRDFITWNWGEVLPWGYGLL